MGLFYEEIYRSFQFSDVQSRAAILQSREIPCRIRTIDLLRDSFGSRSRGYTGDLGIRQECRCIYVLKVRRTQTDFAKALLARR